VIEEMMRKKKQVKSHINLEDIMRKEMEI